MDVYSLPSTEAVLRAALAEDLGSSGDLTVQAVVPPGSRLRARLIAKAAGVVCGVPVFAQVCELVAPGTVSVITACHDGESVVPGDLVLTAEGDASCLLQAERTALNLMQRLSGSATASRRYADVVLGTRARVFDTRKTTPGLRVLEKHAVRCGGAMNHRMGLYDQVLIKENHIALMAGEAGVTGPAQAVLRVRSRLGETVVVQVEIERHADLAGVIRAGADLILLDNMGCDELRACVVERDRLVAAGQSPRSRVELEASGGITLETLRAVAETGVERISVGALTHSVQALDLSLRCEPC